MTDIVLLDRKILNSGLKKRYIADRLGLSRQALYNKLNGCSDFTLGEMMQLSTILGLSAKERDKIFLSNG